MPFGGGARHCPGVELTRLMLPEVSTPTTLQTLSSPSGPPSHLFTLAKDLIPRMHIVDHMERMRIPDWRPKIDVVGFCFLDLASNYLPPEELVKWIESSKLSSGSLIQLGAAIAGISSYLSFRLRLRDGTDFVPWYVAYHHLLSGQPQYLSFCPCSQILPQGIRRISTNICLQTELTRSHRIQ